MAAGGRELYQRFADYDDEELLRILTVERGRYRREALVAAEMVLWQRGVATPTLFTAPEPLAAHLAARAKSPYQFIDLLVDALLLLLVVWAWKTLWVWTEEPNWGGPMGSVAYWVLTFEFLCSVYSLRQRWRTKRW